jgi:hypothetical protein
MMKVLLFSILVLFLAAPVSAQTAKPEAKEKEPSLRERAIKRCKENRGTDCTSERGLREWLGEETPLTDEQQQAAAGARRHREECAKNKKATNC